MSNYDKLVDFAALMHEVYSDDEPIFITIKKDKVIIQVGNSLPVETNLVKPNKKSNDIA